MARNIIAQLRAQKNQYNATENKLINYILADTKRAQEATIQELSNGSGVSTATISRFAKKLALTHFVNSLWQLLALPQPQRPLTFSVKLPMTTIPWRFHKKFLRVLPMLYMPR